STYLTAERLERLNEQTRGSYGGVGISVDARGGRLLVIAPRSGGPADLAGVQPGDRIVSIDGEPAIGLSADEAVPRLRGEPGSTVEIVIERPGSLEQITVQLTRQNIPVSSVGRALIFDGDVGYADFNVFSDSAAQELRAAVDSLLRAGARALV